MVSLGQVNFEPSIGLFNMAGDQCEVSSNLFRYEDGELVLSDYDDSKVELESPGQARKGRRKQTFERRNIKKVRDEALNEEAKAAQSAEMERRKRLLKESADTANFSNIEFLLNDGSINDYSEVKPEDLDDSVLTPDLKLKRPKLELPDPAVQARPEIDFSSEDNKSVPCANSDLRNNENSVKIMDQTEQDFNHKPIVSPPKPLGCASQSLFGGPWRSNQLMQSGDSRDDAILLGDSDEELDQSMNSVVIELSDGEGDDEPEMETEICELQDAANLTDEQGRVVINTNRDASTEPPIYLPDHIARVIKPHQVSGVRFLYDNLIENMERFKSTEGFGCILAHSMGLGKTIQIIGFLEAIFRHCKVHRVLVIVPINTIQNWQAEFEMWLPTRHSLKRFFQTNKFSTNNAAPTTPKIPDDDTTTSDSGVADACSTGEKPSGSRTPKEDATESVDDYERPFKLFVVRDVVKTMNQRHLIIQQWFDEGGVLLLGYEMFRLLLSHRRPIPGVGWTKAEMRAAARRRKKKMNSVCVDVEKEEKLEKMCADFRTALLDPGPQLVICDEGHRIKNSEASISKALKAIRTRRRVVLTGYPLQNNLMEYWCMVDFVRPNYLGTKQEFTNMFQRPIENGQCIDSTPEDRKVMQGRAHVLHDLLSGFVQRRSHAVLKASLPPKTEVVLLVKLSPLQRALYAAFMRSLNSSGPLGWAQVNTLKTYAMCCKIWNHPDVLWRAMEEHKEAMDFDIDDPSANNSFNAKNTRRNGTTTGVPVPTQGTPGGKWPLTWSPSGDSMAMQNASVPLPSGMGPHSQSAPSLQGLCNNQQSLASGFQYYTSHATAAAATYDWASQSDLWGPDFTPGKVEHSGKILLFLSLLEACVQAGDKILVFTQSLYTLDLLERILRHLPLPTCQARDEVDDTKVSGKLCQSADQQLVPSDLRDSVDSPCANSMTDPPQTKGQLSGNQVTNQPDSPTSKNDLISSSESISAKKCEEKVDISVSESDPQGESHAPMAQESTTLPEPQEEETLRSLHYRLASRASDRQTVWTKNVHYFRLDGSTTASEREKLINHFNDPKNPAKLFLVSTRAGCLGVNLIGANRVVVFDASWNPCHDCQAVCRVYRYGQKKPCYIYRLVSDNTMEKRIYDRQVTKQSMSDRVVDELNPCQQFTRSQVESLMSFEDKDMPTLTDEDMASCAELIKPDPVLATVLDKHRSWITKVPFTHESLLIDRKDYRLTRVEKRLARQRYEQEKRLSLSYQRAHLFQYQQMQMLQRQQLLAAGINPTLADQSSRLFTRMPSILSRSALSSRPTYTSGVAAMDAMRLAQRQPQFGSSSDRKHEELIRTSECKITRVVATSDLYFPSTSDSTTTQRKIPKGEMMEIIQTPKGKYLRLIRTGDLFVVKTSSDCPNDATPHPVDSASQSPQTAPTESPVMERPTEATQRIDSVDQTEQPINNTSSTPRTECSSPPPSNNMQLPQAGTETVSESSGSKSEFRHDTEVTYPSQPQRSFPPTNLAEIQSADQSSQNRDISRSLADNQSLPIFPESTMKSNFSSSGQVFNAPGGSSYYSTNAVPYQQQQQQQHANPWTCIHCGKSAMMGCVCPMNFRVPSSDEQPSAAAYMGNRAPHQITYPGPSSVSEATHFDNTTQMDASKHFQQLIDQQQRQEQYLRASEQLARQSAASAYTSFNKQQQQQPMTNDLRSYSPMNFTSYSPKVQPRFGCPMDSAVQDYAPQLVQHAPGFPHQVTDRIPSEFTHHSAALHHYQPGTFQSAQPNFFTNGSSVGGTAVQPITAQNTLSSPSNFGQSERFATLKQQQQPPASSSFSSSLGFENQFQLPANFRFP